MSEILVGSPAIDADSTASVLTIVNKSQPANGTGKITTVEIWANAELSNCEVAIFRVVSGNNLSTVSTHTIGTVAAGSKQSFEVDLDVVEGDFIGMYYTAGTMERQTTLGDGWYAAGDNIPCTNVTFTVFAGMTVSLYGKGETPVVGGGGGPASLVAAGVI